MDKARMENLSPSLFNDILGNSKNCFFHYSKVMFGELPGKLTSPIKVFNKRMYFNINCYIKKGRKKQLDKYTFSLASKDIEEIHVHFGRVPSFVAIETSSKFASAVCKRIGKSVLAPESDNNKKRYILLSGEKALRNNVASDIEQCNLITNISSWTRVNLLSYSDAVELIKNIGITVWNLNRNTSSSLSLLDSNRISQATDAFSFACHKVKFGKLFGKSIAPVKVNANRMYFTFNCLVRRNRKRSVEKYTFSVGASDVSNMFVYVGHIPSFLIVETTKKFADVACTRIGQNVLCPGSSDPKKRYLFLMLDKNYNETAQKSDETRQLFITHVSTWTRLVVLSSSEALDRLRDLL